MSKDEELEPNDFWSVAAAFCAACGLGFAMIALAKQSFWTMFGAAMLFGSSFCFALTSRRWM